MTILDDTSYQFLRTRLREIESELDKLSIVHEIFRTKAQKEKYNQLLAIYKSHIETIIAYEHEYARNGGRYDYSR